MPSLSEAPSGGAKRFLVTFLGVCKKVTRCKSETISSRYRSNGYVHKSKNPNQKIQNKKKATEVAQNALRAHVSEKT
jgi:hypothetical protein